MTKERHTLVMPDHNLTAEGQNSNISSGVEEFGETVPSCLSDARL